MKKKYLIVEIQSHGHQLSYFSKLLSAIALNEEGQYSGIDKIDILVPVDLKTKILEQVPAIRKTDRIAVFGFQPICITKGAGKTVTLLKAVQEQMRENSYDIIFMLYGDDMLINLPALIFLSRFTKVAGLFFRTIFHYRDLKYPFSWTGSVQKERIRLSIKNFLLKFYIRTGILSGALFLDPTAADHIGRSRRIDHCPDPIISDPLNKVTPPDDNIRFVLFGYLNDRKGLDRLEAALKALPCKTAKNITITIAGQIAPEYRDQAASLSEEIRSTSCTIRIMNQYMNDDDITELFSQCDIMLLPYKEHIGCSNVLYQCGFWKIPVIAHNFGLIGYQVEAYNLGLAIDTSDVELFSNTIARVVNRELPLTVSPEGAAYCANNTADKFVNTIYSFLNNLSK